MAVGMGAATATLVVVGGKIVKTAKSAYQKRVNRDEAARLKNRIKKHLPSDKNKNWNYETIDPDGNYIKSSKASLLENPDQKMYIVNKDGVRIEIVDGYPQFGDITNIKASIKNGIVLDRDINFMEFDKNLADYWSTCDNPEAIIPDDFKEYFRKNNIDFFDISTDDITNARKGSGGLGYTWHESEDMHTGYLVPTKIHRSVSHNGGIEQLKYLLQLQKYKKLQKQDMYNALENLIKE